MSQRVIEACIGAPVVSRRDFTKALAIGGGAAAATGLLGASIGGVLFLEDHLRDHRTGYEKSVPSDFLHGEVTEWDDENVKALRDGAVRKQGSLLLESNSYGEVTLQGEGHLPIGRRAEITFPKLYSDTPTYDVVELVANGQRRLATLVASPEPEETTVLFDPFETEAFAIDLIRKESGREPIALSDLSSASLTYIDNIGCSADLILSLAHGILPRDENDTRGDAQFDGYSVLYFLDGEMAILNVNLMILETRGTKPKDLYRDTKTTNQNLFGNLIHGRVGAPGRTTDVEWGTLVIIKNDGTIVKRIQKPHHSTGDLDKSVIKTVTENNNYEPATEEEAKRAQFKYRNKIISPAEYTRFRNMPNPYVLWLSLEGLYLEGKISGVNDPIVKDVLYYYPRLQGISFRER